MVRDAGAGHVSNPLAHQAPGVAGRAGTGDGGPGASSGPDLTDHMSPAWLTRLLAAALVIVAAAAVAGWISLALVHLGDRYRVGHVQGAWMALAQYANDGTLYPPLSDGTRYAGTRWMPLPILVNAAAARITGEYLVSGKSVAMLLFAALIVLVLVALRQGGCPPALALGLTGLLPATNTGILTGSSVGGDVLPVVLQLGVLLAAMRATGPGAQRWMVAAGVLAGLAACSKLTGLWAAAAVGSWLGMRAAWRPLAAFAVAWVATVLCTLGVVQWASDGRFLATFLTLTFAGTGSAVSWMRAPSQLIFFGIEQAAAVWIVAPFALAGVVVAWRSSTVAVAHHALGWSLLLTLVVFTDVGAGFNQLLDPAVLTVIAVGHFVASRSREVTLVLAAALAIVWGGITGVRGLVPDLREAAATVRAGHALPKYDPRPLAGTIGAGDTVLSEDSAVAVLLGRTPVVLDAFMLRRLDELQPARVDGLVARIQHGEFDHVVLVVPLHGSDQWWQQYHFGPRVARALREHYVLAGEVDGYYLYRPVGD
jgi:hypothetical protein